MADKLQPWEQQQDESDEAYEAFVIYADMPTGRTLAKVAGALGKSEALMERWSARDGWRQRVLAKNRHEARQINEDLLSGRAAMRQRHIAQAQNMQARAAKRIKEMTDAEISQLTPGQTVQLFTAARMAEIQARSVGDAELEAGIRDDAPEFTINFVASAPESMVPVRLTDGTTGYIPRAQIAAFQTDYPDATVIA